MFRGVFAVCVLWLCPEKGSLSGHLQELCLFLLKLAYGVFGFCMALFSLGYKSEFAHCKHCVVRFTLRRIVEAGRFFTGILWSTFWTGHHPLPPPHRAAVTLLTLMTYKDTVGNRWDLIFYSFSNAGLTCTVMVALSFMRLKRNIKLS